MRYVLLSRTTEFLWHGTTDKNLKTILSQGLVPSGKFRNTQYDKGLYKSIHGIYLSTSLPQALNYAEIAAKRDSHAVLILVKVSYDNENFALDEDKLNPYHFKGGNEKDQFNKFIDYYKNRLKPNAHRAFIHECNKNKQLILDWINSDSLDKSQEDAIREYSLKITKMLGKFLTSKIKELDDMDGGDKNWKSIGVNKPIKYSGANSIKSIWVASDRIYGITSKFLVQIYGKPEYNSFLKTLQQRTSYEVVTGFYGIHEYKLLNDILNERVDFKKYIEKYKKLPKGLSKLHELPKIVQRYIEYQLDDSLI